MIPFARILDYGNIAPEPVVGKYKKICCNYSSTMVLGGSGNLYSFGSPSYGEVISGRDGKALMATDVDDCWLGGWGSLYKTKTEKYIYNGFSGTLGVSGNITFTNLDITSLITDVIALDKIKKVQVAWRAIYILSTSGDLYAIGMNSNGQLLAPSTSTTYNKFTLIYRDVVDFVNNDNNCLFVIRGDSKIYAAGNGSYIGVSQNTSTITLPKPIVLPAGVSDLYTSFDDVFAVCRTGAVLYSPSTNKLYACGAGGGAFNKNASADGSVLTFSEVIMRDDSGFDLEYKGKMFGGSGDPMYPAILMQRIDKSSGAAYGYYFSASNASGAFGVGNNTYQRYFYWSGIEPSAELINYNRNALYYSYGNNFLAAGDSSNYTIPGYTTAQYFFVRPTGFRPEDEI
ncbi:hypothetical protein ACUYQI_000547 [Salmonella enterica subsp. enterica serovar Braenderup]